MLEERFEELWAQAGRLGRPVVSHRKPGVSLDVLEQSFGTSVPPEVASWFGWCNGVAYHPNQTQDDAALVPGYEPLSVEEAVAIKEEYPEDSTLGARWFPILSTGGGDFYAVVEDRTKNRVNVVSVVVGEATRLAFNSVEQMLETFIECFRSGVFYVDVDGFLQADDERWLELEEQASRNIP